MIAKKQLLQMLLWMFFIFLNLQMLSITGWMTLLEESNPKSLEMVKVYHVVSILFLPFFIKGRSLLLPALPRYAWHFIMYVLGSSVILYYLYGFNSMILNYVFCFYTLLLGSLIRAYLSKEEMINIFRSGVWVIVLIIFFKLLFYTGELQRFMREPHGHPGIEALYGGGVNLEATWLALNCCFFVNSRKRYFYPLIVFSFVVGILYASRVGAVLSILIYFLRFISPAVSSRERRTVMQLGVLGLLIGFFFIDIDSLTEKFYGLKRFAYLNSSEDGGMVGRKAMWEHVPEAFVKSNMLGYGAGNGIRALESVSNIDFLEDNLHNYYIQVALEFGVIALIIYLIFVYNLFNKIKESHFGDPLCVILVCYFIGSLIQFRGTETMIWLYIGIVLYSDFSLKKNDYIPDKL